VWDRPASQRHCNHVLLSRLDTLADRFRHLASLADPSSDVALAITNDDDGAECEAPAAFDDLGHAIDLDYTFLEITDLVRIRSSSPASIYHQYSNLTPAATAASCN
jgi:hypothetical protein